MSNEMLLKNIYAELEKVKYEISQTTLKDPMIPTLCGWELALKWVINEIKGESDDVESVSWSSSNPTGERAS